MRQPVEVEDSLGAQWDHSDTRDISDIISAWD
jgi:hypothetical protein